MEKNPPPKNIYICIFFKTDKFESKISQKQKKNSSRIDLD